MRLVLLVPMLITGMVLTLRTSFDGVIQPPDQSLPHTLQTPVPDPGFTPAPSPTPVPGSTQDNPPGVITQIFKVVFSAETLSEALSRALELAAEDEVQLIDSQTSQTGGLLSEILLAPQAGLFAATASSALPTAAALAPALFAVRLAIYHWRRLLDSDDSLLQVFGDWIAAGFLAVSAGPFLDLVIQAGWWMGETALGETGQLAASFVSATTVTGTSLGLTIPGNPSIFRAVFLIAGSLGGLLGVVGLAFAFAISQAVLFVMATIAPIATVIAVVPQMRWIRGIWLKAVAILALMPVAAGGIFKAGVSLAALFGGGGLLELLIRLLWLWGAVGFMLSLAGILGRVTLSTAAESGLKIGRAVKTVVSTAALAGGAPVSGAQAVKAGSSQAAGSTALSQSTPPSTNPSSGFDPPASGLSIRELSPGGHGSLDPAASNTSSVKKAEEGELDISGHFYSAGFDPIKLQKDYPEEMARIKAAFAHFPEQIASASEPLAEAVRLSNADEVSKLIENQSRNQGLT